jgi:sec-independent protein translocase protein TatB
MAGSGLTGFLQNFGGGELIVILLVALVVLGPERLPEMARSAGKALHKLRTMTEGLTSDMKDVIDDPAMQPLRELGELAARPRQKLAEYALEAEAEERARAEREALASTEGAADGVPSGADAADPDAADPDEASPDTADPDGSGVDQVPARAPSATTPSGEPSPRAAPAGSVTPPDHDERQIPPPAPIPAPVPPAAPGVGADPAEGAA